MRKFQPDLVDRKGESGYDKATLANPAASAAFRRYIIVKLGEKLQQLRKQSGLSQEQLAAQLTVSRQAVSKWELDETMPDTENVIQLSRLFGVSCDYLLRDEVDEQGAANAPEAGGAHLTQQGWTHNAFTLSLGVCTFGLVTGFMFYRFGGHTVRPLVVGLMIQMLGLALFELATPRMGSGRNIARLNFYRIACWLVLPVPQVLIFGWIFDDLFGADISPMRALTCYFAAYLLLGAAITAVLSLLRRRQTAKK